MANFDARERLAEALQPLVSNNKMRRYARQIKVSSNTVAKWLSCESFPSGTNVAKVAQSLGMSLDDFNAQIIEGRQNSRVDPADQAISIVWSLPPSSLARVLRSIADLVEVYETAEKPALPVAAENPGHYEAKEPSA